MNLKSETPDRNFYLVNLLTVLLLAIAYFTHLSVLEVDPRLDEVRRALVSLEMMLSGNYLVPTINGEPYLNKPPLYNWLLVLSYKVFGINEFALRFPVFIAIFFFGWLIFYFTKKFISTRAAVIASLLFMTNGRILIYDSLIGLIDILYSALVYLSFMVVYLYGKKEQWYRLFIFSYLLVVAGFLMKGLPSFIYQAFVLLVFFFSEKKWKVLFHKAHFAGIFLMVVLLGSYYYVYFKQVNLSWHQFVSNMVEESTKRTVTDASTLKSVVYILTYPLIYTYNFAPWTVFMLLVWRKDWLKYLKQNNFIWFNAILFFCCSFIYWLSPNSIARYVFMLVPLSFTVVAFYYCEVSAPNEKVRRIIETLLIVLLMAAGIGCIALPFIAFTNHLPGVYIKAVLLFIALAGSGYLAWKNPSLRLSFIILGIVCSRFGFNWFVVEQRGQFSKDQRAHAEKVMELAAGRPIFMEKGADHGNPDGLSYNIELNQKRILFMTDSLMAGALYITDSANMVKKPHTILYRWGSQFQPNHYLVKYQQSLNATLDK